MAGSPGGGQEKGDVKNKKTYIGDQAGRSPGILDWLLGEFASGGRGAGALSDLLTGGKNFGRAKNYYGYGPPGAGHQPTGSGGYGHDYRPPQGAPGGGGADLPENYSQTGDQSTRLYQSQNGSTATGLPEDQGIWNQDGGNDDGGGDTSGSGDGGQNDEPGRYQVEEDQERWARENPNFDPEQWGGDLPTDDPDSLISRYKSWQDNPWQTGPNGESETDVLGTYDWLSSGERTGDERDVYDRMGRLGSQGTDAGGGRTLEGLSSDVNRDIMSGPNANERELYGETGEYGNTRGADQATAANLYRNMVEHGGYDEATQRALTTESMAATRSPFERSRDRILRGAAARGNPGSTVGADIALARDESNAMGSTARKNRIDIAREKIRQNEAGGEGLMGSQAMTNAQKQYAIGQRAAQNAQQAGQRLAGSAANTALANDMAGRRERAAGMQAGENTKMRGYQMAGAEGKGNMFDKMFGRKQAGAAGTQHVADTAQQERAGDFAGLGNIGGRAREEYVETGGHNIGI
jgi:hypothetical protein